MSRTPRLAGSAQTLARTRPLRASLRAIAAAVGGSTFSVRRALAEPTPEPTRGSTQAPVVPEPADRAGERAAARRGQLVAAPPVFAPAGQVPLARLLLAMPGLQATGLLPCTATVFGGVPNGFYGLQMMLVEGVLCVLAGEPRAEGATRVNAYAVGRILGLDRASEVRIIRRKITALAPTGTKSSSTSSPELEKQHLTRRAFHPEWNTSYMRSHTTRSLSGWLVIVDCRVKRWYCSPSVVEGNGD